MINTIRKSKVTKVVASYLAIQLIVQMMQPMQLWALTSGPSQPEFNSFTPIGTSDMVNLSSGNFNYNIPVMDVGGYPLNLAYDSGVSMDQEASWVGLGWNLNVGQINRQVRGIPDDFKGDEMTYENNMRDNVTVGVHAALDPQIFGIETPDGVNITVGADLKYNNYSGLSFKPSFGLSIGLSDNVTVGMQVETSATEGATISPSVSAKFESGKMVDGVISGALNAGVSYNSTQGLSNFSLSGSLSARQFEEKTTKNADGSESTEISSFAGGIGGSGRVSFVNPTLTPRKRTAFTDINGTVALSLGADVWGLDGELEVSAMGAVQKIKDPLKVEKAYGYEFTGFAGTNDVLDYNREKDGVISKSTLVLPTTSYTYDTYNVQGQGAGGMFRPFRSQIGQINDEFVEDESASFSLGVEIEPGSGFHTGVNFTAAPSSSHTGIWETKALQYFKQEREDVKGDGESLDYESVYFKYIGEPRVDKDQQLFEDLGGYSPIALKIGGSKKSFDKYADNRFRVKTYSSDFTPEHKDLGAANFKTKFKRKNRDVRNQNILKVSAEELTKFYDDKEYAESRINEKAQPHHTAEVRVQNADGSTYVYGETAYNNIKKEVTFTTDSNNYDCATGIVNYNSGENTRGNRSGIDHFFNAVHTPAYAHTYLLSSVLSSDYEDVNGDGPTDDDLGAYTLFEYKAIPQDYKWRVPYAANTASYNAGLNTNKSDQKGSYIYGEKELKYINKIITKTHVALFDLSTRKDGRGTNGENGGNPSSGQQMYKIDKVRLYSKPEAIKAKILDEDPNNDLPISAIKTAHFIYDYSQCQGVDNNLGGALDAHEIDYVDGNGTVKNGGKLTLKQVYFTYRNSKMGKYTPYKFNYGTGSYDQNGTWIQNDASNPDYNLKSYDVWGNYKPNVTGGCNTEDPITAPEFPFVQQDDRELQNTYASAWSLSSINLPSGGKIDLTYESDDYQYVQDRETMQMFKVVGAGGDETPANPESNSRLYKFSGNNDARYLYVKLPSETDAQGVNFNSKYLKGITDKPVYFRFLMNMTKAGALSINNNDFDYVTGYFELETDPLTGKKKEVKVFNANNAVYAAIPMQFSDMEGGVSGNKQVNPISKAGWYFGRQYLNGQVYGINSDYRSENFQTIAQKVVSSFAAIKDIFTGPNAKLRSNQYLCAQRFVPEKSWIRLSTPKKYKLGGGTRIKKLVMKDQWNKMVDPTISDDDQRYLKEYGQTYDYTLGDGSSSGVATYEPNMSKENPFVEPFYNKGERLIAPREVSYVEKPFGESFFPGATVTYSMITVSNLAREGITKHATGKVVTEHFTSKDYPTIVDYTDIDSPDNFASNQNEFLQNLIKGLFGQPVETKNEFALSQGFVVHTNDMNGKMRFQKVYAENQEKPISSVEYKYSTEASDVSKLNNKLPVISRDGNVNYDRQIGVDYDIVTDFRESYSRSQTKGYKGNLVVLMIGPFPVPVPMIVPSSTKIENVAHSTITTKVIHTTAVMKEKIATDLGSKVSTINEAWDAETGQVLLTRTINEFDDEYYNFNFPAYWAYDDMGQASRNVGITGTLKRSGDFFTINEAKKYFTLGDEIIATYGRAELSKRLWVVGFNGAGNGVLLMNKNGSVVNKSEGEAIEDDISFRIVRSGRRNQQMANMGAITMMKNPITDENGAPLNKVDTNTFTLNTNTSASDNLRIVNASAVEYNEFWNCQCESELPFAPEALNGQSLEDISQEDYPFEPAFNPYLYNAKGEWRAKRSYAYLTERTNVNEGATSKVNTRREGYFKEFTPYYSKLQDGAWQKSNTADDVWTFASEVTQYSPFGAELENKDALDRYSAAQYGYNYTLPTAVSSNSRYRDMGMDGFEDYAFKNSDSAHFNFKKSADKDGFEGIQVSENVAHTGRTSLLIPANESAELERNLIGELPKDIDYDNDRVEDDEDNCPYDSNRNQADYDGDGIGDACDDDAVPSIFGRYTTNEVLYLNIDGHRIKECVGRSAEFVIHGNPNETIQYAIIFHQTNYRGMSLRMNDKLIFGNEVTNRQGERFIFEDITLDITGQKYIDLDFDVVRAKKRKGDNAWRMEFMILNKSDGTPVRGTSIDLSSHGRRVKSCGEPTWGNLDQIKH
ncbi:thrombospondin type 3 repeat-containing protein [Aquimarina sp. 2201CG5-10]|uniref:thrombospondin type 3 repeat-containing protein n=1 Tax=Aquimarina callyspongiae TaxID=3098150 RepID=UPI002AB43BA2|nr:thrombospondin type 3 repeat-containing protein [Aquimarina sp. 2201CG5-10]MDY8138494.1 thrombospondin type 3 repeat-containing protein [Aquimarina sp. 2201CG5-10]